MQLTNTKSELERFGVHIDISLEFEPDLEQYDIVHLSNVTRIQETYLQMKNAKKQGKPVVLSTIFWPMDEFEKNGQVGIRKVIGKILGINSEERIKAIARYLKDRDSRNDATKNLWRIGYKQMQQYVVEQADYYLPNSEIEMAKFCNYFNVAKSNYVVVPNGIDDNIALLQLDKPCLQEFEQFKDAIICVGRIETRKNQLSLLKALEGSDYKVVLVGQPSSNQPEYIREIMQIIDRNSDFYHIAYIEHDKLYQLYKCCKVSALPSWLDTPGLVSLEAAAMGCNLAISTRGSTEEYFREYAEYCEPDDIQSIRYAVDRAYKKQKTDNLKNLIFQKYTWKRAAEKTLAAYKTVLEQNQSNNSGG